MKKHGRDTPKLEVEESEFPSLFGDDNFKEVTFSKGTSRFSQITFLGGNPEKNKNLTEHEPAKIALEWQSYSELDTDHGLSLSHEILFSEGFGNSTKHTIESMSAQIAEKVGERAWKSIETHLLGLDEESGHRKVFLQAGWAQLFAEPFEELWLAAMAQHAFYVLENDFAFGYLTAQIDQKRDIETHFLRGKKSIESASLGGLARSSEQHKKTQQTLTEMNRLIENDLSIARAASLAYKNGFGTSDAANKKLWARHSKK